MEAFGYLSAIFIGLTLGLFGGGGSILTVPVLVYLFQLDMITATAYSLFIVGAASVAGSLSYFQKNLISIKLGLTFGITSILSIYLTRAIILPAIPKEITQFFGRTITRHFLLMVLFAILMLFAAQKMIFGKRRHEGEQISRKNINPNYLVIGIQGLFIGFLTGLVGAGGGFLIVPVLVHWFQLPMKKAVGTSLFIISLNSLLGFVFSLNSIQVDWLFILSLTGIAIIGIIIGSLFTAKINGQKLKIAFGWFVLIMAIYILLKEWLF